MRAVLVDTHILLWARIAPDKLTEPERRILTTAPRLYLSAVSLWEIAILAALDRVERDPRLFDVPDGFTLLPVMTEHCRALMELPPIHRDPFDRMLIAQARTDKLALLTRDAAIAEYVRQGCLTLSEA
ncbi:MAG: type II toxin-antitoxin system VapC family toxin [Actinomycetota bacterium]